MLKSITTGIFILLVLGSLTAMQAEVKVAAFKSGNDRYAEVYMHISSADLTQVMNADSLFQAAVDATLIIKSSEGIQHVDKFTLHSPVGRYIPNFIDIKRYALPNGSYRLELTLTDHSDPSNEKVIEERFSFNYPDGKLSSSEIHLLESANRDTTGNILSKNGYLLDYKRKNRVIPESDIVLFYQEIYEADVDIKEDFMIRTVIASKVEEKEVQILEAFQRQKSFPQIMILNQMNISTLREGDYTLIIELRDRNKRLISRKRCPFYRMGKDVDPLIHALDEEALRYSLKALAVIWNDRKGEELNQIISKGSKDEKIAFLIDSWNEIDPRAPRKAYEGYMAVAKYIDQVYNSGLGYGFESDRGYIYMNYGPPDNIISEEQDPMAPPYEIWTYYDFPKTNQTNVKFLFYNPDLAGANYQILHSTAIGEINNPRWQFDLYGKDTEDRSSRGFLEGGDVRDSYNRNAVRYFRDN